VHRSIQGDRHRQALVNISVLTEERQAKGRAYTVNGWIAEMAAEQGRGVSHGPGAGRLKDQS
jgi:hypothetical protein